MPPLVKKPRARKLRDNRPDKARFQDLAQTAKRNVDPEDTSEESQKLIDEWRMHPGRLDVMGVDDAAAGARLFKRAEGAGQGEQLTRAERRRRDRAASQRKHEGKGYGDPTFAFSIRNPNQKYWFQWRVQDMDEVIPSHTTAFEPNPAYLSALQPRDRDRGTSKAIVRRNASQLADEILLYDTGALDVGPPIVGDDKMVESGNGRFIALQIAEQAYPARYARYTDRLRAEMDAYGLDGADFAGVTNPVLVRERITPVDDRIAFVTEANNQPTQAMSAIEQARSDARTLSFTSVAKVEEVVGADLDTALLRPSNRAIVQAVLRNIPKEEQAALLEKDGKGLSQKGIERVKSALFHRVYEGEAGDRLTGAFFDTKNEVSVNLQKGLQNSLPAIAQMKGMLEKGEIARELDITNDLAIAIDTLIRVRKQGLILDDYLAQSAFGGVGAGALTPAQQELTKVANAYRNTPAKWREFLTEYARWAAAQPNPMQGGLGGLGGGGDWQASKMQALKRIYEQTRPKAAERLDNQGPSFFDVDALSPAVAPASPRVYDLGALTPSAPRRGFV